jgi:hypothetical protein
MLFAESFFKKGETMITRKVFAALSIMIIVAVVSYCTAINVFTVKIDLLYDASQVIFLGWLLASMFAKVLMLAESRTPYPGSMRKSVLWSVISLVLFVVVLIGPNPDNADLHVLVSRLNEGGLFVALMIAGLCLTPLVDVGNIWSGFRGRKTLHVSETT